MSDTQPIDEAPILPVENPDGNFTLKKPRNKGGRPKKIPANHEPFQNFLKGIREKIRSERLNINPNDEDEAKALIDSLIVKNGMHPMDEMFKLARHPKTPAVVKAKLWSELTQFLYPKKKAVESAGVVDNSIKIVMQNFSPDEKNEITEKPIEKRISA